MSIRTNSWKRTYHIGWILAGINLFMGVLNIACGNSWWVVGFSMSMVALIVAQTIRFKIRMLEMDRLIEKTEKYLDGYKQSYNQKEIPF
jgi:hypothetical protein